VVQLRNGKTGAVTEVGLLKNSTKQNWNLWKKNS
jgi:hypothetical protein